MPQVIVSYDGTRNDRDALALGGLFAKAGADLTLAYVRHAVESDSEREAAEQQEAEHVLAVGAELLGNAAAGQRVIVNPSTASGLAELASELGADIIAFGSSHKTPPGRVNMPHTAQTLVERSVACSLALAPAGLRREPVAHSIGTVRVAPGDDDPAAGAAAASLAHALGAVVTDDEADFVVIPSRPEASPGKLLLSSRALQLVEQSSGPVLLLAHGAALSFG